MAITFNFQHPITLHSRRKLRALVQLIFANEKTALKRLDIIFCSDKYLLQINRTFLSHDYFTDIITFNLGGEPPVEGEIYISVETAKLNACIYNVLTFNELSRLIIHGCLHLCGYQDKKKKEKILMTAKENRYLSALESL